MNEIQNTNMEVMTSANELQTGNRIEIIEDALRKKYLSRLSDMPVAFPGELPVLEEELIENVRLFKVTEMVYRKGEFATDKFTTVFNTLSGYRASVFLMMDSDGEKTDIYVGVRNNEYDQSHKKSTVTLGDALINALTGHFPGIKIKSEDRVRTAMLSQRISRYDNVASVSVVGNFKQEQNQSNEQFVQGLEKLIIAMQGRKYTGVIIADNQGADVIEQYRHVCQNLYTAISPYQKIQTSSSYSSATSRSKSFSEMSSGQKMAMLGGALTSLGGVAIGAIAGAGSVGVGVAGGAMVGGQIAGQLNGFINSLAPNEQITKTETSGTTYTQENKTVTELLELIDGRLKKTKEFYSYGMWNVAGYFASDSMSDAEIAANNYRSLMNGENSSRELSAVNSWRQSLRSEEYGYLTTYISRFAHPKFVYVESEVNRVYVDATTSITGKELGLHLGLPRAAVVGLPVIEHAEFGKEVATYNLNSEEKVLKHDEKLTLGKVFDLGKVTAKDVELENASLNMHTFVTGSTGSGKSNTVYQMLSELRFDGVPFLVIEPAKGEYKDVFGHLDDVNVYSTNPNVAELIRINPFMFPESIHVLEHIDGLVEIFSVCWPMYDAMPAFFKEAILRSYESIGWDLGTSTFDGDDVEYPDFEVLVEQLNQLIEESDYASDIKSNYRGALVTRTKSLTVGLNKYIFTANATPYQCIFDENCVLDISRVKSGETKALIMGLLVYMLNEYRADQKKGNNNGLKHVTVLEEAHNLLKNTSGDGSELVGKSVEMITQTIAEIRTYGEGFIIVDQSPSSVDVSAIKNTNTKIVLRTPEKNDREAVGRSMGLSEDQVNEIARLPGGVAVVYQNDWVNPILTRINKAQVKEIPFVNDAPLMLKEISVARTEIIKAIMEPWIPGEKIQFEELVKSLNSINVSRANRKLLSVMICTYRNHNGHIIWKDSSISLLKEILMDILCILPNSLKEINETGTPDNLRGTVISKTSGLKAAEVEEICYILTMEG